MSTPLYFGESASQLYGVYHPPRLKSSRQSSVLVCAPFGQEYMRTHRALRQLAVQLARAGHHVLRFDYYGTGDSAGSGEEASVRLWLENIGTAADELKDTTGARRISVVGLRFGAFLAAQALVNRDDLDDVVFWDPVVSGRQYLRELLALREKHHPEEAGRSAGILGIEGFPLTPQLRAELESAELDGCAAVRARRLFMVTSEPRVEYRTWQVQCAAAGVRLHAEFVDAPARWDDVDRLGAVLLPQAVIHAIVGLLGSEAA